METSRIGRFLDRCLDQRRIRFVCAALIGMSVALLAASFATWKAGRTAFGPPLGGDFAAFYTAGTILNGSEPYRLYDPALQFALNHKVLAGLGADDLFLYAHAPFFAVVFRPLARLPFTWALFAWIVISVGLYLVGFVLVWRTRRTIRTGDRSTAMLLMLAFEPFLVECLHGGQASAFGFFWIALSLACERSGRPIASGLALAPCLYKPTLLPLLLPMLLLGRQWRTLLAFTSGAAVLAGLSLLIVGGWQGGLNYVHLLTGYARGSTGSSAIFRTTKYVDVISFFRLLLPGWPSACRGLALSITVPAVVWLAVVWWRAGRAGADARAIAWAATLSWTAVFNLYAPIYDTMLILPGVLVTDDLLRRAVGAPLRPGFQTLLVLLVIVPWITQPLAAWVGFQPFTLVLAALGAYFGAVCRAEFCGIRTHAMRSAKNHDLVP
jgi:hypothetical protein